jgi:hypothetical protein
VVTILRVLVVTVYSSVPKLRTRAAAPPLALTSSWRGAELCARTALTSAVTYNNGGRTQFSASVTQSVKTYITFRNVS